MSTQYDPAIDAVIYGSTCKAMTQEQWVKFALACLDQAGMTSVGQAEIERRIRLTLQPEPLQCFGPIDEERASDEFLSQARMSRVL